MKNWSWKSVHFQFYFNIEIKVNSTYGESYEDLNLTMSDESNMRFYDGANMTLYDESNMTFYEIVDFYDRNTTVSDFSWDSLFAISNL